MKVILVFLLINCSTFIYSQVGIGTTNPSEKLEVVGNVKFSGAIMPNNDPGTAGKILTSNGPNAAPTWSTAMLNQSQTTAMGKFFSETFNIPTGYSSLTLNDPNCVITSTCAMTWVGPLANNVDYGDLVTTIEAQNGKWIFHFANYTGFNLTNHQFSFFAFY
ncbi:MAG TPA: hypothetical protein ENK67_06170 [Flavobacteriia bacterium]|nr:hypothetical protein [Flavobacteriia bacterium]